MISRKVVDSLHFTCSHSTPQRATEQQVPSSLFLHACPVWDCSDAELILLSTTLEGFLWPHLGFRPEFEEFLPFLFNFCHSRISSAAHLKSSFSS